MNEPKKFGSGQGIMHRVAGKEAKFSTTKSKSELMATITDLVKTISDDRLRDSLSRFIENGAFKGAPSSPSYHHAYENGNLEHTVEVLSSAIVMASMVDDAIHVDRDVLIAGAILHDIGKEDCYEMNEDGIVETETSNMNGHVVRGIQIAAQSIESEKIDTIIHVIASHHATMELGSPVHPETPEAWIVHLADSLSARLLG